jgi:hypothetical protein
MFRFLFVQAILSVSIDYCNCKKYNRKINSNAPKRGQPYYRYKTTI